MTGLDLTRDALIEIAVLVTDGDLKVLGDGVDTVEIDADSYRTKAAREQRDAAHAAGKIPVLVGDGAFIGGGEEARG